MRNFTLTLGKSTATFRFGVDYAEGDNRFCWTLAGIEKLIACGLWKREFDKCGNLKSKPMTVEAAMKLRAANRAI
jgi:hypothetical protein